MTDVSNVNQNNGAKGTQAPKQASGFEQFKQLKAQKAKLDAELTAELNGWSCNSESACNDKIGQTREQLNSINAQLDTIQRQMDKEEKQVAPKFEAGG